MVLGLVAEHIVGHLAILEYPMASDIGVFFVHMDFVFLFQSFGNSQGFAFSIGDGMMVMVTSAYFFGYGVNVGSYNKD